MAQLCAALDRSSETQVQENLGRCFVLWPGMPAALETLERLGTLWQRPEWAVQRLEALASTTWERAVGAELWSRVARLRMAPLGDRDAATAALIQAFRLEPGRQDTAMLLAELLDRRPQGSPGQRGAREAPGGRGRRLPAGPQLVRAAPAADRVAASTR